MGDSFKLDFIGIGASKAGTTWLGHMLDAHPQICVSEPREVEFFNEILQFREKVSPNYSKGFNWYRKFFNHCKPGQLKGEITPRYGMDPIAAKRIREHNPQIKIFLCMRSPVDRIWSHYRFASSFEKKEDRVLEMAIREEPMYMRMSQYFKTISLYLEYFSKDQIFLVWFEDIQQKPDLLLKDIYTFLGVDPAFRPPHSDKASNAARISRFRKLQRTIRRFKTFMVSVGLSGVVKNLKKAGLGEIIMRANSRPLHKAAIQAEMKEYIIDQVRDDVIQLSAYTGKDLSHWLK